MFKNYLKISFRNFSKNKAFTFINIFGLAVGLTSCLLIVLYIFDERSYDKFQKDGDRLFRIASVNNKGETWAATAAPLAFDLKNNLPEIEQATRLMTFPDIAKMLLKSTEGEQKQFFESNGYYVDSVFFQVLTYNFIYGNGITALADPNSMVISKDISNKFFGDANPVGKLLLVNTPFGEFNYTVKAVFDNSKYKSHIPASYFLSMRNNDMWNWVKQQTSLVGNNVFFTYVKLKNGTDPKLAEQKVQKFFYAQAGADMKAAGFSQKLFLQSVPDIYLHSSLGNEIAANGNLTYLYILGSIAAFILLIAIHLFSEIDKPEYAKYLIQPRGQINRDLIESEWPNSQRIIATLGLKEMTQSALIKKLCTYTQENRTRLALFEFDKLIRSIHTLKYFLDAKIQKNTHRSQNRVESYHQLRAAIAQAYGKKQLIGRTDIALEVSNQCGRLIANAIIHYNSTILS